MPIYVYRCAQCAHKVDRFKRLVDIERAETCPRCAAVMDRQIAAPFVAGDYPPYECPISGKTIYGRRQHEENLRRHGCRLLEPGERQEAERRRRQTDVALERQVEESVAQTVAAMAPAEQEALAQAFDHGLDVNYTRGTANAA